MATGAMGTSPSETALVADVVDVVGVATALLLLAPPVEAGTLHCREGHTHRSRARRRPRREIEGAIMCPRVALKALFFGGGEELSPRQQ
jgi:hypothetical protein